MDVVKEELDIFKASMGRMRWMMITASLISVLIVLHVYLEQFGYQAQQLGTVHAHRMNSHAIEVLNCMEAVAKQRHSVASAAVPAVRPPECAPALLPEAEWGKIQNMEARALLLDYSKRIYTKTVTDNTLKDAKLAVRRIPLLGIEVPANDFVNVMAVMSLVFVIGVWMNLRGVKVSLGSLLSHDRPEAKRLAQISTVFLISSEAHREDVLARRLRSLVLWLPFVSIGVATVIGHIPLYAKLVDRSPFHVGNEELALKHLALALAIMLVHLWIAVECRFVVKDIDRMFQGTDPERA